MNDIKSCPILRTYRHIKVSFKTESYICLVKDKRYRHAISWLRCSSHMSHIQKGRYTRPKIPLNERLCYSCYCVEDELHLVTAWSINLAERRILFAKVADEYPGFDNLDDVAKFVFLVAVKDAQMLTWLGKLWTNPLKSKHHNSMKFLYDRAYELSPRRLSCHPRWQGFSTRRPSATLVPTRPQWCQPVHFDVPK